MLISRRIASKQIMICTLSKKPTKTGVSERETIEFRRFQIGLVDFIGTDPILLEAQPSPLHQIKATFHKHSLTWIPCVYYCMLHKKPTGKRLLQQSPGKKTKIKK
jgi:hypothetical protein